MEVGKQPGTDDEGGILVFSMYLLIVSVTGSEVRTLNVFSLSSPPPLSVQES